MPAYFSNFPKVYYSLDDDTSFQVVTNIIRRVIIREGVKNNGGLYIKYELQDGDTAEIIADKLYGDPNMHWIIFLMNDIINPYYDMPLSQRKLEKYTFSKHRGVALFLKDIASSGITSITKTDYENMSIQQLESLNIAGNQSNVSVPQNTEMIVDNELVNVVDWNRTQRKLVIDSDILDDILLHGKTNTGTTYPIRLSPVFVLGDAQDSAGVDEVEFRSSDGNSIAIYTDSAGEFVSTTAESKVMNFAALNHFENDEETITIDVFGNDRMDGYINSLTGSVQEPAGVITNENHEEKINNEKLLIKILKPEYASLAINEIKAIFGNVT